MIHSVWDWKRLRYDYYQSPTEASIGGWKPLTGLGTPGAGPKGGVGIDIEDALPTLPPDARPVGHGIQAVGQVCVRRAPIGVVVGVGAVEVPGVFGDPSNRLAFQAFLVGFGTGALLGKFKLALLLALAGGAIAVGVSAGERRD